MDNLERKAWLVSVYYETGSEPTHCEFNYLVSKVLDDRSVFSAIDVISQETKPRLFKMGGFWRLRRWLYNFLIGRNRYHECNKCESIEKEMEELGL